MVLNNTTILYIFINNFIATCNILLYRETYAIGALHQVVVAIAQIEVLTGTMILSIKMRSSTGDIDITGVLFYYLIGNCKIAFCISRIGNIGKPSVKQPH